MNMKVLYVESSLSGHRKVYHKSLIDSIGSENAVLITPEQETDTDCEQVVGATINLEPRTISEYKAWIAYIKNVADVHKVSVIHFLDGDLLYRFCGYRLRCFRKYTTVATFHHISEDLIHTLSVYLLSKKLTYGVVHTDYIKKRFKGLVNIKLINYPYFPIIDKIPDRNMARDFFGISSDKKVLLALGGTRYEKGVDILLNSLKEVPEDNVVLLIAGKEEHFKRTDLERIDTGKIAVIYYMNVLSDMEWGMALSASDIVALPYRRSFEGASGPLTEAVWFNKPVISKNNGSMGDIVKSNDLGWTFETESIRDLGRVIDEAVNSNFVISDKYKKFVEVISVEHFYKSYNDLYKKEINK